MALTSPIRTRLLLTGAILLAELALLAWEHTHGGIQSHHILHRADLPAVSNGWGILVLPGLAWFLVGRVQRRSLSAPPDGRRLLGLPAVIAAGFAGSLLFGGALAVAFTLNHDAVASFMFASMFAIALLLPVYHGEYVLGFVLGMTFTFGALLPTAVGCIFALISAILRFCVRQAIGLISAWRGRKATREKRQDSATGGPL